MKEAALVKVRDYSIAFINAAGTVGDIIAVYIFRGCIQWLYIA